MQRHSRILARIWCIWMSCGIEVRKPFQRAVIVWVMAHFTRLQKCTIINLSLLERLILTCSHQEHIAAKKQQDHGVDKNKKTSHALVDVFALLRLMLIYFLMQISYCWRVTKLQQFIFFATCWNSSHEWRDEWMRLLLLLLLLAESGSIWSVNR